MHWDGEIKHSGEDEPLYGERIEFKSVGIDIGSSTSHLMFSRLVLARGGREYFSGYKVIQREVIYRSPILLTPYCKRNNAIDVDQLDAFLRASYADANLSPTDVDTGAVITTGEAAKKENAEAIIHLFAESAGKFVCATAGPNLEAILAAHGSGAVHHSCFHGADGKHRTFYNIDVGGGTTKIAVIKNGRILETCAINVGSRLIAWDKSGTIHRIEDAGRQVAASVGVHVEIGSAINDKAKKMLAKRLAELLTEVFSGQEISDLGKSLMITPGLSYRGSVDMVIYSGGTAEFIYERETKEFGDLGPWLGEAIRLKQREWNVSLGLPDEGIRSTVIGASQYTVQVSGNTILLSDPAILPIRNVAVVTVDTPYNLTTERMAESVRQGFRLLDREEGTEIAAIAMTYKLEPKYSQLMELALGLKQALPRTIANRKPFILIIDADVGKLLGHILLEVGFATVISVDNIDIGQLSYVDIGRQLEETRAVPVTVKSLVFR